MQSLICFPSIRTEPESNFLLSWQTSLILHYPFLSNPWIPYLTFHLPQPNTSLGLIPLSTTTPTQRLLNKARENHEIVRMGSATYWCSVISVWLSNWFTAARQSFYANQSTIPLTRVAFPNLFIPPQTSRSSFSSNPINWESCLIFLWKKLRSFTERLLLFPPPHLTPQRILLLPSSPSALPLKKWPPFLPRYIIPSRPIFSYRLSLYHPYSLTNIQSFPGSCFPAANKHTHVFDII